MSNVMAKLPTVARIFLGLVFFVFGLNGFLHFIPQPPPPPAAGALFGAFAASGYLLALIKGTEVIVGALLLSGRFVPLALAVLAPIMINIVAFHAFLAPSGLGLPMVLVALHAYLAWAYRAAYAPMLRARATPGAEPDAAAERERLATA
jgi:uncharacterized membrane protein YphA (DoxX/SURF4 family)